LLIVDNVTGNTVTLSNQFALDGNEQSTGEGATGLIFDDGTTLSRDDIASAATTVVPIPPMQVPDGDQDVFAEDAGETIIAGHGDDTFFDDDRNHTFIYHRGDGNDFLATGTGPADRETTLRLRGMNA